MVGVNNDDPGVIDQIKQVAATLIRDISPRCSLTTALFFIDGAVIPDTAAIAEWRLYAVVLHPFTQALKF